MDKAIITSASNKFFPAIITLLASIKINYPSHPTIFIYDLGLFPFFRKELENIEGVKVIAMPKFCPFWQSCFTWKTYIFKHPIAKLNLYLDSGFQALKPFDEIFDLIKKDDYFFVGQNAPLSKISPEEFKSIFNIDEKFYNQTYVTAGLIGFKSDSSVSPVLSSLYDTAKAGLCLGFSPVEKWKNKGKNKNQFTRNCDLFRFDTTLLSMVARRDLKDFIVNPWEKYESGDLLKNNDQILRNARLKRIPSEYFKSNTLHNQFNLIAQINRLYIKTFLLLKNISLYLKKKNG